MSPTSVLRLNFESLLAETTDPVASEDNLGASATAIWDAVSTTLPECVRTHRVVSWIEEGLHTQPVFFKEVLCIKKVHLRVSFFIPLHGGDNIVLFVVALIQFDDAK